MKAIVINLNDSIIAFIFINKIIKLIIITLYL